MVVKTIVGRLLLAVGTVCMTPSGGAVHPGEPENIPSAPALLMLTPAQMDAITAGGVVVSVDALALAGGTSTYTSTTADTFVVARPGGVVQQGFGKGEAKAIGDEFAYTDVSTSGFADGDIVVIVRTGHHVDTPRFSLERGRIFVNSVSPPGKGRK